VTLTGSGIESPKRIQRQRTKGWRMPPNAVYVGRPSPWGNPYSIGEDWIIDPDQPPMTREDTVELFRTHVAMTTSRHPDFLAPLVGRDLACWCDLSVPCHADVLLELANAGSGIESMEGAV
jgi:hypothetical protein